MTDMQRRVEREQRCPQPHARGDFPAAAISGRGLWVAALATMTLVIGAAYVWVVNPGLPYDEPSHWSTVLYYADHERMPVLGDPGVTYEAQQGPVAYAVDAVIVRAARAAGSSSETSFRLVRLFGIVELAAAVVVVGAIARRLVQNAWASIAATVVFALNPMLLTMSASVQNDTLVLLLGVVALLLALRLFASRPGLAAAAGVGGVAGFAVLTKLTAAGVVAAVAVWLAGRDGRDSVAAVAAFLGAAAVVSGWWFVLNVVRYGDPTASSAVEETGVSFAPYRLQEISDVGHVVQGLVTYLWLPTEYVRNQIGAPIALKAIVLAVTLAILVLGLARVGQLRPGAGLIVVCGVVSIFSWLVLFFAVQSVPPRITYFALPLWIVLVALALSRVRPATGVAAVIALLLGLNVWTLYELAGVTSPTLLRLPG